MGKQAFVINAKPYPQYEDAVCDYLAGLRALMQGLQEPGANAAMNSIDLASESLVRGAAEIAEVSASMLPLAHTRLNSKNPAVREGIRLQLLDQAIVELLIGIELLKCSEEQQAGLASSVASRATRHASLREAICAVEKSSSIPLSQCIPSGESHRAMEPATAAEAAAALKLAMDGIMSGIRHRVQELGRDIAFDLISETQGAEILRAASLSDEELAELLGSMGASAGNPHLCATASRVLLTTCKKIATLLGADIELSARGKMGEWLNQIRKANRVELFDTLIENLYQIEALKAAAKIGCEVPGNAAESLNRASELTKAVSDKFTIRIGRMRKLEDALRLGNQVRIPQLQLITAAMQTTLLAALVQIGHDYIHKDLGGILYKTGLLAPLGAVLQKRN